MKETNKIIDAINNDKLLRGDIEKIVLEEDENRCEIKAYIKKDDPPQRVRLIPDLHHYTMRKMTEIADFGFDLEDKCFLLIFYPTAPAPPDKIPLEKALS